MNSGRLRTVLLYCLGGLIALYALSGICMIQPDEQGVVRLLGKALETPLSPGMNYVLPWPISRLDRVKVSTVKRVYVGMVSDEQAMETITYPQEKEFITGDINIIDIRMIVQYKIKNAADYLFRTSEINRLIQYFAEQELTRSVGKMDVELALTAGKVLLQDSVMTGTQRYLDSLRTGVQITSAHLQEVSPPQEVAADFKEVWNTRQNREKKINEAQGYRNEKKHEARGEAERVLRQAEAFRTGKVNRALGESERFTMMLREYHTSPSLARKRLYLETMERILPKVKIVVGQDE